MQEWDIEVVDKKERKYLDPGELQSNTRTRKYERNLSRDLASDKRRRIRPCEVKTKSSVMVHGNSKWLPVGTFNSSSARN